MKSLVSLLCLFAIVGFTPTTVVAGFGSRGNSWSEEVRVPDGQLLFVHRTNTYSLAGSDFSEGRPVLLSTELEFTFPADSTNRIVWSHDTSLFPRALLVQDNVPVLITTVGTGRPYLTYGCNGTPYYVFAFRDGGWKYEADAAWVRYQGPYNLLPLSFAEYQQRLSQNGDANRPLVIGRDKVMPTSRGESWATGFYRGWEYGCTGSSKIVKTR